MTSKHLGKNVNMCWEYTNPTESEYNIKCKFCHFECENGTEYEAHFFASSLLEAGKKLMLDGDHIKTMSLVGLIANSGDIMKQIGNECLKSAGDKV